jgi:hypothetical protein
MAQRRVIAAHTHTFNPDVPFKRRREKTATEVVYEVHKSGTAPGPENVLIILYFVGVHTHHATGFIGLDGMPPPRNSPNYFTVLLCSVYPPQILFFLFRPPWLKMPDVFGGPAAIERCVRILCC